MGLDMSYQAIPADSILIKKATEYERTTTLLSLHGFKEISDENLKYYANEIEFTEYKKEAEKIRHSHSNIENREFYLGRRWDMLHYLLSENRRRCLPDETWANRAINGGEKLGGNAVLPQGVAVRFLTLQEVKEISKHLGQIETNDLETYWNPPKMREAGVYKIRGDESDNDQLYYLKEEFEKLKEFYLWVAIYDEAVLVFCD